MAGGAEKLPLGHGRGPGKSLCAPLAAGGDGLAVPRRGGVGLPRPHRAAQAAARRVLRARPPPQARNAVWDRLCGLRQRGVTLILTPHNMDEAEQLCARLVVMDKGKIVAEGSPPELIRRYSTREVVELRFGPDQRPEDMTTRVDGLARRLEALPDRLLLYTDDGDATATGIHDVGLQPDSVLVRRSTLEDVFLHLTGRTLVDE